MASPKNVDLIMDQQFCLRWNNFQANLSSQFETLRNEEDFVDVTFACGGKFLGAHKIVLSACSPYFKILFKNNPCSHPVIFMRDVEIHQMETLLEFIYSGEVNISQTELSLFLKTAEALQIRGLTEAAYQYKNTDNKITTQDSFAKSDKNQDSLDNSPIKPQNSDIFEKSKRTINQDISSEVALSKRNCPNNRNEELLPVDIKQENEISELEDESDKIDDLIEPKVELTNFENVDENFMNLDFDSTPLTYDMNSTASTSQLSLDNETNESTQASTLQHISTRKSSIDSSTSTHNTQNLSRSNTIDKNIVNQQANNSVNMNNTRTLVHSLVRRPCPICGRVYSNHSNLRQHINLIHSPEAVTCPICQKSFRTKLYLRRHLASYHNERSVSSNNETRVSNSESINGWSSLVRDNVNTTRQVCNFNVNVGGSKRVGDCVNVTQRADNVNVSRDNINGARIDNVNVNGTQRADNVNVSRDNANFVNGTRTDNVNCSTNDNIGIKNNVATSQQDHGLSFYGKLNNEYLQEGGVWCDIAN